MVHNRTRFCLHFAHIQTTTPSWGLRCCRCCGALGKPVPLLPVPCAWPDRAGPGRVGAWWQWSHIEHCWSSARSGSVGKVLLLALVWTSLCIMCTAPSHHHHHEYSSRVWSPMSVCSLSLRMCSQLALCWSPCFCRNRTSPHLEWVSEGGSEHFWFFFFFWGLKLETEIAQLFAVIWRSGTWWEACCDFLFYFLKIVGLEWWRNS